MHNYIDLFQYYNFSKIQQFLALFEEPLRTSYNKSVAIFGRGMMFIDINDISNNNLCGTKFIPISGRNLFWHQSHKLKFIKFRILLNNTRKIYLGFIDNNITVFFER